MVVQMWIHQIQLKMAAWMPIMWITWIGWARKNSFSFIIKFNFLIECDWMVNFLWIFIAKPFQVNKIEISTKLFCSAKLRKVKIEQRRVVLAIKLDFTSWNLIFCSFYVVQFSHLKSRNFLRSFWAIFQLNLNFWNDIQTKNKENSSEFKPFDKYFKKKKRKGSQITCTMGPVCSTTASLCVGWFFLPSKTRKSL